MKMWIDPPEVYLYRDAVDFRKSINGLVMIVEQELGLSPFAEALYVFCNRGRDKLKLVYWDKTGFALWYKRLEKDKFKWPTQHSNPTMSLSPEQWQWLLAGYDVVGHRPISYACAG
jgi:transposase